MASLESENLARDTAVRKCAKEAINIVFSLPELSRDEQAKQLVADVTGITLEVAGQAIDMARTTF